MSTTFIRNVGVRLFDDGDDAAKIALTSPGALLRETHATDDPDFMRLGAGVEQTLDKCGGDSALGVWAARKDVRAALNVVADSGFFSGDNGAGFDYACTEKDLRPFYAQLANDKTMRLLVYNGDTDVSVNYLGSQNWTSHLGLRRLEQWRSWTLDGNRAVAGMVTHYAGLDFVTIRGSGHMVPRDKPRAAFELLNHFLSNVPLPRYKAKAPAQVVAATAEQ